MFAEETVRKFYKFYFFALLEEELAHQATLKAYQKINLNQKNFKNKNIAFVHFSNRILNKYIKYKIDLAHSLPLCHIQIQEGVDLGVWREYRYKSDIDEVLSLIWSKILHISDDDIAEGLGVTLGTVRHRVSHGLRNLAQFQIEVDQ